MQTEDYDLIDQELTRFAEELNEKEQLAEQIKQALTSVASPRGETNELIIDEVE